jgi:hypothetical protein
MIPLAVLEQVIDTSGVAPRIEAMLPIGARARQLSVRTLLAGMCLAQADHRPATSPASTRPWSACREMTRSGSAWSRTGGTARTC